VTRIARPYSNPYLAGAGLGLVLLAAYLFAGRGLGASGAFVSVDAGIVQAVAPETARGSALFARHLEGEGPWRRWLLFEMGGAVLGAAASAALAGRLRREVERGPRISAPSRLAFAFAGGALMAFGAILARGCTSGQALTGGALLAVGSWLFVAAAFAAAFAAAPFLSRLWR
jgi:uncharacterized membrane protein YedE/YeeE